MQNDSTSLVQSSPLLRPHLGDAGRVPGAFGSSVPVGLRLSLKHSLVDLPSSEGTLVNSLEWPMNPSPWQSRKARLGQLLILPRCCYHTGSKELENQPSDLRRLASILMLAHGGSKKVRHFPGTAKLPALELLVFMVWGWHGLAFRSMHTHLQSANQHC